MTAYTFNQVVNIPQLQDEMTTAGLPTPSAPIAINDNVTTITFSSDLSGGQVTTLNNVMAAHVPNPAYVTLQNQADIATLIAYLNNINPLTANTARAVMVLNFAPRLPDGMLQTINAQIATKLAGG